MSVTSAINHAKRVKQQATAEQKLDQLADAIEALARVVGEAMRKLEYLEHRVQQ